jgi:Ran GTPase-activating protein (RanGAP) involved in mRNA processing and transport
MIRSINLSMNHISDKAAETLSNLLKKNFSLAELYLHYNQITHIGGI